MEDIINPTSTKKRKSITKVSEKMRCPFKKIRKRYLPRNYPATKLDIRDYFSSSCTDVNTITDSLTNGEPSLATEHKSETYDMDSKKKGIIKSQNEIVESKILPNFKAHALSNEEICNGDHSSVKEGNLLSTSYTNGHLNAEKNVEDDDTGPPVFISNTTTIVKYYDNSTPATSKILSNSSTMTYKCTSLSESPLRVDGCELKPLIDKLDPLKIYVNGVPSASAKNSKSSKRKLFNLTEGWITKKQKTGQNKDTVAPTSSPVKRDKPDTYEDPFEVEHVVDYSWCKQQNQGLYFVKWIGYPESQNTWEPLEHLECSEKLKDFYALRLTEREKALPGRKRFLEVPPDPRTNFERASETADKVCPPPCMSEVETFFINMDKKKDKTWPQLKLDQQLEHINKAKKLTDNKVHEKRVILVREQIMLRHVKEKRAEQEKSLKEWEAEVNTLDRSSVGNAQNAKITVQNDYDLEGPPRHMTYMNSYKPSEGIIIPDDPPIGCECAEGKCGLKTEKTCCSSFNGHRMAYTAHGRLRVELGTPIYECNKKCTCDKECTNRVVQKGRKVKLCIYRTSNGCGWGVKAHESIKKGSFVVEYVGEVITNEQAEERGKKYDAEGRTYLFDLDFNMGDQNPYTVDAAFFGNVSHFINHSCDPNLSIFNLWIDCLDPNLPRLCLYANRDIAKYEQLTFDYRQRTGYETDAVLPEEETTQAPDGESDSIEQSSKMECRCGATNCRKILFV